MTARCHSLAVDSVSTIPMAKGTVTVYQVSGCYLLFSTVEEKMAVKVKDTVRKQG